MKPFERLRTVEAVIISHKDFGEADRLVSLFSREIGKIRGLAKGVRKMGSRKAAYLEPFMQSKVVLARGKTFWIITQADAIKQHLSIRDSLKKTASAAYVMELADRFTIEEEPAPRIFRLIADSLQRIDERTDVYNVLRYYELQLMEHAGFRPDLTDCVGCGKLIIAQDQFFSTAQGGALCPECGALSRNARKVSIDALRYLRHLQRSSYSAITKVDIPKNIRVEMSALMNSYIASIVERRLNAPEFMRQVTHSADGNPEVK